MDRADVLWAEMIRLAAKVKELEVENERLKAEVERLKSGVGGRPH